MRARAPILLILFGIFYSINIKYWVCFACIDVVNMKHEKKMLMTLEQLMAIDFYAEAEKYRATCWIEGKQLSHVKQTASAKIILSSTPCNSEQRKYLRHVMKEGYTAIKYFKAETCHKCGNRLQEPVPPYRWPETDLCSCKKFSNRQR